MKTLDIDFRKTVAREELKQQERLQELKHEEKMLELRVRQQEVETASEERKKADERMDTILRMLLQNMERK